ncbi:hypothetical protein EZM97_13730 [Dyella soli]|uniref:Uncharacterized protein n=1 Tax=Dyella soli TaxID=522319 RepID=A0A4R0YU12_9GAMM|nr:hypothetical protein [Dyella soli]TCI09992.1 hypothetical protein EZM97_13730 [Dyella soli]
MGDLWPMPAKVRHPPFGFAYLQFARGVPAQLLAKHVVFALQQAIEVNQFVEGVHHPALGIFCFMGHQAWLRPGCPEIAGMAVNHR